VAAVLARALEQSATSAVKSAISLAVAQPTVVVVAADIAVAAVALIQVHLALRPATIAVV